MYHLMALEERGEYAKEEDKKEKTATDKEQ
jgi:hypothetical protein